MPDFTPGPWVVEDYGVGIFSRSGDCSIVDLAEANSDKEKIANARLIAAAPEMYKLMKSVVDFDHTAFKFDTDGNLVFIREKYDEFRDLLARIDGTEATAMKQTLKPCPFCGASAKIFYNNDKEHTCYIECGCCFVRTDNYYDKKYLVEDWNRRYTLD